MSKFRTEEDPARIPWSELFLPFVKSARQTLQEKTGGAYDMLIRSAHAGLEAWLIRRLTETALPLLNLKLSAFQAVRQPLFVNQSRKSEPDNSLHQAFVTRMLDEGLPPLFCEFPVFENLLTALTDFWIESCREFLGRLRADWRILQKTYDPKISQVTEIRGGLSDPHHRGRSVLLVVFDSGLNVLCKPRNLNIDSAWFDLLCWFNQNTDFPEFKTLRIISRQDYGWMEYARHQPFEPGDESLATIIVQGCSSTRSWEVSIRNAVRSVSRINKRRKAVGYYLGREELAAAVEDIYSSALDSGSLKAFEGRHTGSELGEKVNAGQIRTQALKLILESQKSH